MKRSIAILLGLVVVMAQSVCCAAHPLDEAGEALTEGNVGRAVDIYREAVALDPTAEGYNNLGVALERSGLFAESSEAYAKAKRLADGDRQIRGNLLRARIRAFVQFILPYAAYVFGVLLVFFLLIWLVRRLIAAWHSRRFRMKFRGVRVVSLAHHVRCRDGQDQPDGRAYPDSESISFTADLVLPQRGDIYPLDLELEVLRPDGAVWRTLPERVETGQAERVTLRFPLDRIGELLGNSGTWKAQLILRNTGRRLASVAFVSVSHADLVADLKATDVVLLAVRGGRTTPEKVILTDVETLVPTAVIRPKTFHPSKFAGIQLRLDLVNVDKRDIESQEFPLELSDGAMRFCSASRPVAGDEIARKLGRWEFRLSAEGRRLARLPFLIVSVEQALDGLKIESFDLAGIPHHGRPAPVGKVAYVRNLRSLCPVVRIASRMPLPSTGFRMTMSVCVDDEPVGGIEGTLTMAPGVLELVPGEFVLPRIPDGRDTIRVSFVLLVEGRNLGIREVVLRTSPPRYADAQGRIMDLPQGGEIDYDSEAERILREARIR